jgi:hypothetical protein
MMFCKASAIVILFSVFLSTQSSHTDNKDPFASLGIPDLNPKALLAEIDSSKSIGGNNNPQQKLPKLKSIDDLPNFLKSSTLNEEEGVKVLTRFLIQDDVTLKKYGVVYDQTGFDGITTGEPIAPVATEERLIQRARSAANIWVFNSCKNSSMKSLTRISMPMELKGSWMRLSQIGGAIRCL